MMHEKKNTHTHQFPVICLSIVWPSSMCVSRNQIRGHCDCLLLVRDCLCKDVGRMKKWITAGSGRRCRLQGRRPCKIHEHSLLTQTSLSCKQKWLLHTVGNGDSQNSEYLRSHVASPSAKYFSVNIGVWVRSSLKVVFRTSSIYFWQEWGSFPLLLVL